MPAAAVTSDLARVGAAKTVTAEKKKLALQKAELAKLQGRK